MTEAPHHVRFEISPEASGRRLDHVVAEHLPGWSRAAVKRLFADGRVTSATAAERWRRCAKGDRAVAGRIVRVRLEGEPTRRPDAPACPDPNASLTIVLERSDLVVVDKPAGQPCAPLRPGETGTLANALIARYPEMAGVGFRPSEPGLCHRLDNATSGLVLAARTPESFRCLRVAMRQGRVHKRYLLICAEAGLPERGTIEVPLRPHPHDRRRVIPGTATGTAARQRGRAAQTSFRVLERHSNLALVEVRVAKALRHQIRAHFAFLGHPLAGDGTYRSTLALSLGRHALHAALIRVASCPGVAPFEARSPLPPELRALLS